MADLTKVQQAIQTAGGVSGIRNLAARQKGNVIEITGQADSIAAKQTAIRTITERAGDQGLVNLIEVAQDTGRPQPAGGGLGAPASQPGAQQRTHTVKKGETLGHIAQQYYGKASEHKRIFEANRDQLKDPDKIREGATLRIP